MPNSSNALPDMETNSVVQTFRLLPVYPWIVGYVMLVEIAPPFPFSGTQNRQWFVVVATQWCTTVNL